MERKKCSPLLAGELHPQGFFQGGADGLQGRQFLLLLHSEEGIAGVGCQEPGHVFGIGQRRGVKGASLEGRYELLALELGRAVRMHSLALGNVFFKDASRPTGFFMDASGRRAGRVSFCHSTHSLGLCGQGPVYTRLWAMDSRGAG